MWSPLILAFLSVRASASVIHPHFSPRGAASHSVTFTLDAHGKAAGQIGQLDDGQNRIGGSLPLGHFTLVHGPNGGMIWDSYGRGCIVTPPTTQIQCDEGAQPMPGFDITCENQLVYQGSSQFFACPVNDHGVWNIYTHADFGQKKCVTITLSIHVSPPSAPVTCVPPTSPQQPSTSTSTSSPPTSPKGECGGTTGFTCFGFGSQSCCSSMGWCGTSSSHCGVGCQTASGHCDTTDGSNTSGTFTQSLATPVAVGSSSTFVVNVGPPTFTVNIGPQTISPCIIPTCIKSDSMPTTSTPASFKPTSTPPSSMPPTSPPPSSKPATSTPLSSKPATSTPLSSKPTTSTPPTSKPSTSSQPTPQTTTSAPPANTNGCPTNLHGHFEFPHLIIPVDKSSTNRQMGNQFEGLISDRYCSIFKFDITPDHAGKKCSLVWFFPHKSELETSTYHLDRTGQDMTLVAYEVKESVNLYTSWSTIGPLEIIATGPLQAGRSWSVHTQDCLAGEVKNYMLCGMGFNLKYFQDYNPEPIGLYVRTC